MPSMPSSSARQLSKRRRVGTSKLRRVGTVVLVIVLALVAAGLTWVAVVGDVPFS